MIEKYYEVLGIGLDSNMDDLRTAYRKLAREWHPDKFSNEPEKQGNAHEMMCNINHAFDVLRKHIASKGVAANRAPASKPNDGAASHKAQYARHDTENASGNTKQNPSSGQENRGRQDRRQQHTSSGQENKGRQGRRQYAQTERGAEYHKSKSSSNKKPKDGGSEGDKRPNPGSRRPREQAASHPPNETPHSNPSGNGNSSDLKTHVGYGLASGAILSLLAVFILSQTIKRDDVSVAREIATSTAPSNPMTPEKATFHPEEIRRDQFDIETGDNDIGFAPSNQNARQSSRSNANSNPWMAAFGHIATHGLGDESPKSDSNGPLNESNTETGESASSFPIPYRP